MTFLRGRAEGARVEALAALREVVVVLGRERDDVVGGRRLGSGPVEGMRRALDADDVLLCTAALGCGRGGGGISAAAETSLGDLSCASDGTEEKSPFVLALASCRKSDSDVITMRGATMLSLRPPASVWTSSIKTSSGPSGVAWLLSRSPSREGLRWC